MLRKIIVYFLISSLVVALIQVLTMYASTWFRFLSLFWFPFHLFFPEAKRFIDGHLRIRLVLHHIGDQITACVLIVVGGWILDMGLLWQSFLIIVAFGEDFYVFLPMVLVPSSVLMWFASALLVYLHPPFRGHTLTLGTPVADSYSYDLQLLASSPVDQNTPFSEESFVDVPNMPRPYGARVERRDRRPVKLNDTVEPHFLLARIPAFKGLSPTVQTVVFVREAFQAAVSMLEMKRNGNELDETVISEVRKNLIASGRYNVWPEDMIYVSNAVTVASLRVAANLQTVKHMSLFSEELFRVYGVYQSSRFLRRLVLRFDSKRVSYRRLMAAFFLRATLPVLPSFVGYIWNWVAADLRSKTLPAVGWFVKRTVSKGLQKVGIVRKSLIHYTNPRPDIKHPQSFIDAANVRLSFVPEPNAGLVSDLSRFVAKEQRRYFVPIDPLSFEDWLNSTKYSQAKKQFIRRVYNEDERYLNKIFVKNESYPEIKPPRLIFNASQNYKNIEGPYVAAFEEQFHQLPGILSGIPVNQWAEKVQRDFCEEGLERFLVTDFSSFEASVSKELKEAVENQIYHYVFGNSVDVKRMELEQVSFANAVYSFKDADGITQKWKYTRPPYRRSGDQRTYQANTLLNFFVQHFAMRKLNVTNYKVFVSGDDALIGVPKDFDLDRYYAIIRGLGLRLTDAETNYFDSDFCGFNFHPEYPRARIAKDHYDVILKVFDYPPELSARAARKYVKEKAYCYLIEYAGDPILDPPLRKFVGKFVPKSLDGKHDWWTKLLFYSTMPEDVVVVPDAKFESISDDPLFLRTHFDLALRGNDALLYLDYVTHDLMFNRARYFYNTLWQILHKIF